MNNEKWVPVKIGNYPGDMKDVQVTFIGHDDQKPHCEAFAYRCDGKWYWSLWETEVMVEITAWKDKCEPYVEEE